LPDQLLACEAVVRGDALEDAGERADFDRMVIRNRLVVFAVALGGHAHVRAALPIHGLAEHAQRLDQLRAGHVARQPHRAKTSSRTTWRRMTFGDSIVSSK
jgi:hypothetical protein